MTKQLAEVEDKETLKKEFLTIMQRLENEKELEEVIKDNKIVFKVEDTKYRVRKPNYDEQTELEKVRREKYLEMLGDDTMKFRKQWITIYKNKGIDVDKMETEVVTLQTEIDNLLLKMATTTNEEDIEKLRTVITEKKDNQAAINIEKTDLLGYSIEDALMLHATSYYTYLVLEKLEPKVNKWSRVFDNYHAFASSIDADLINKAIYNVNYLIYAV